MTIRTKPPTEAYKQGFDRIFSGRERNAGPALREMTASGFMRDPTPKEMNRWTAKPAASVAEHIDRAALKYYGFGAADPVNCNPPKGAPSIQPIKQDALEHGL